MSRPPMPIIVVATGRKVFSSEKKTQLKSRTLRKMREGCGTRQALPLFGLCTERRLYQSLCLPAGVPSDQSATPTKNTRIGGSPFIWDGSFDEKNQ